MMKFEVSGATPEEFAQNATRAFALMTVGLQRLYEAAGQPANPPGAAQPPSTPQSSTPPSASDVPVMEPLENPKIIEPAPPPSPKIKPEQIKDRLAQVILSRGTPGARSLLTSVGANKVTDIDTDEKRVEFMQRSEAYLTPSGAALDDEIPF